MSYLPDPIPQHTVTYHSRVPPSLALDTNEAHFGPQSTKLETNNVEVIVGVDEAGRGPVLGPMVYSAAYCSVEYGQGGLNHCGFADSKKLTDERRRELMIDIESNDEMGFIITYMTPRDISSNMLAPWNLIKNLNEQAHQTTMNLIQELLNKGLNIQQLYVDTVGPPDSYRRKLEARFPSIGTIRVEKKADDKFPIVSGASVCAKVPRDQWIDKLCLNAGSGYPGDPNTKRWLKENMDPWFGWDSNIRYSWSTARDLLLNTSSDKVIPMKFEDDDPNTGKVDVGDMFKKEDPRLGVSLNYFVK